MGKDNFHSFRRECTYSVITNNSAESSDEGYFVRTTEYTLYPNKEQERKLLLFLEVCRYIRKGNPSAGLAEILMNL